MPFSREPSTTAAGALPLLEAVGEVEQLVGRRAASTAITITLTPPTTSISGSTSARAAAASAAGFLRLAAHLARARRAASSSSRGAPCSTAQASPEVTASIRRAPEPTEPSLSDHERADLGRRADVRAAAELASRSRRSRRRAPRRRTSRRTASSRRACAPRRSASTNVRTGRSSKTFSLTMRSTCSRSSAVSALRVREVEAELVGPDGRARLLARGRRAPRAAPRAAGASRCGSPSSGSASFQGTTARTRSPAAKPSPREDQHLVVAEPHGLDELGAARPSPSFSMQPTSDDLAAALGVERRLVELPGTRRRRASSTARRAP